MNRRWERLRSHQTLLLVAAGVLLAASCSSDGQPRGLEPLDTPTFAPSDSEVGDDAGGETTQTSPAAGSSSSTPDGGAPQPPSTPGPTPSGDDAVTERVDFDDPVGDATPGVGTGTPPGWSDLAGGALERRGDAYGLTVRLGADAPERAPGTETMNIASFYDVDGDGSVDYEIWVNLGPDGWGPVWYDDEGNAALGEDSNVTVEIEGDEVRLLFPAVMLASPDRLRFSIASEYGELSTIGSSFARRDDAPDDDRAVSFPG